MAGGLIYYVPKAKAVSAQLLEQEQLTRLLSTRQHREILAGPDGPGLLIAAGDASPDSLRYEAASQRWSPRYGLTSRVGHWVDHPPGPAQLARPAQLPGSSVRLLDGQDWTVPVLRAWQDTGESVEYMPQVPRVVAQSQETGRMVLGDVVPEYASLWERSCRVAESLMDQLALGEHAEADEEDAERLAVDLLAVNYHVDLSVISHLRLLAAEHVGEIIRAALDWSTFREALKKRLLASPSSDTDT